MARERFDGSRCGASCLALLLAAAPAWAGAGRGRWLALHDPETCLHDTRAEELVRRENGASNAAICRAGAARHRRVRLPASRIAVVARRAANARPRRCDDAADPPMPPMATPFACAAHERFGKPRSSASRSGGLCARLADRDAARRWPWRPRGPRWRLHVTVADAPASGGVISSSVVMSDDDEDLRRSRPSTLPVRAGGTGTGTSAAAPSQSAHPSSWHGPAFWTALPARFTARSTGSVGLTELCAAVVVRSSPVGRGCIASF